MNMETPTDSAPTDPVPGETVPPDQPSPEPSMADQDLDQYLTDEFDYKAPSRGDLRTGVVIQVDESGVLVDCGYKREGYVPAADLNGLDDEYRAGIVVGAEVPVFVVRAENREGQPTLSLQQARLYDDWLKAEQLLASGEPYGGVVSGFNRGGLVVKYGEIRGFVPASQVVGMPRRLPENERRERLEAMVGREIGLRVIEVDRYRRRLIFSQRRALRAWQELKREQVMNELSEGETRHGQVTDITSFGAFVDLGGADGLVHVSEISWKRVNNPRDVLRVGQEVDVYVLNVDQQRKRIALSLKKLLPDPWTLVDEQYRIGQLVEGRVTRVLDFGAFIELDLGIEGLLHVSEMIGAPELQPSEILQPRQTALLKIIRIDSHRKRLALSAKQVRQSEWERWMAEQQVARLAAAAEAEAEAEAQAEAEAETAAAAAEAAAAAGPPVAAEEPPAAEALAAEPAEPPAPAPAEALAPEPEPEAAPAQPEEAGDAPAEEAAPAAVPEPPVAVAQPEELAEQPEAEAVDAEAAAAGAAAAESTDAEPGEPEEAASAEAVVGDPA